MKPIPFLSLSHHQQLIRPELDAAISEVVGRGQFIMSEQLRSFELEFARWIGTSYCIGVGNGLDALTLALSAAGIGANDEVIVPSHTYIATWLAVSRVGAAIRPVEPDEQTFNIDTARIEDAIGSRTRAILPVHMYGQACDMSSVLAIASKHGLKVIEDNAQAHGALWEGRRTGSWGVANATSFYPSKNLGAFGDGGAITTQEKTLSAYLLRVRNYGFESKNIATELGVNSRLDELQAAVLRVKLKYLESWNEERRQLASEYLQSLRDVGDLVLPHSHNNAYHVYHLFVVRTSYRDKLSAFLRERSIETMIHYPMPPHLQTAYAALGFGKGQFPITERMADTVLSLPLWPGMTNDDIDRVCGEVRRFFASYL